MLLLLALACTKGEEELEDPFRGNVAFTVEGGAAVSELVELEWLGWSEIAGDGFAVLTAADDNFVWELMLTLEGVDGPGTYTPTKMRYRKGLQALIDAEASCAVTLQAASAGPAPWQGSFSCEGLHTESGLEAGDEAPWSIVDGAFSGGAYTTPTARDERLAGPGYAYDVELSRDGATVDQNDPARALVIPWRGEGTGVVVEDGADDSLDDLTLRLEPDGTSLGVRRWAREQLSAGVAIDLRFLAEDPGISVAVDGGAQSGEGTDFLLRLWDDAREGDDLLVLNIR